MQVLRAGSYRPRSNTITTLGEVDWSRRGLDSRPVNGGRSRQIHDISRAVSSGMGSCGMNGLHGLSGGGCNSSGAQAAQALLSTTGAVLAMVGASQAASAQPQTFSTADGAKTVTNVSSRSTNLATAGGVTSAVGNAWTAACQARADARAGDTLALPPPGLAPPAALTPAAATWIPGVSNNMVLAGAAVAAVGAALLLRR